MKIKNIFAAVAFSALLFSGAAHAATIDLGSVAIGQSGPISTTNSSGFSFYDSTVTGVLPNNSQITFTYTLSGFTPILLSSYGDYNFHTLTTRYDGLSFTGTNGTSTGSASGGHTSPVGGGAVTSGNSLVLTSANLTPTGGTATITNTSIGTANFVASLLGFLSNGGKAVVTYAVSALSNVPLPSSALLFGLGLMAFASFTAFSRKQRLAA